MKIINDIFIYMFDEAKFLNFKSDHEFSKDSIIDELFDGFFGRMNNYAHMRENYFALTLVNLINFFKDKNFSALCENINHVVTLLRRESIFQDEKDIFFKLLNSFYTLSDDLEFKADIASAISSLMHDTQYKDKMPPMEKEITVPFLDLN